MNDDWNDSKKGMTMLMIIHHMLVIVVMKYLMVSINKNPGEVISPEMMIKQVVLKKCWTKNNKRFLF